MRAFVSGTLNWDQEREKGRTDLQIQGLEERSTDFHGTIFAGHRTVKHNLRRKKYDSIRCRHGLDDEETKYQLFTDSRLDSEPIHNFANSLSRCGEAGT